jgi:hypothetical protein
MILVMSRDAYIFTICITPMHVQTRRSATCSLAGVHVGRTKRERFCSSLETMRDMRGNHARQSIVNCDYENSSPLPVTG